MSKESSDIIIILLFAFLGKVIYDFKMMGGFNYPLLIKIIYMIMIILGLVVYFHSEDVTKAVKQTKIEDYFRKSNK